MQIRREVEGIIFDLPDLTSSLWLSKSGQDDRVTIRTLRSNGCVNQEWRQHCSREYAVHWLQTHASPKILEEFGIPAH